MSAVGLAEASSTLRAVKHQTQGEQLSDPYIELVKQGLTHTLYGTTDLGAYGGWTAFSRMIGHLLRWKQLALMRVTPAPEKAREEGLDWPIFAQTMIGRKRLDNLHHCVEDVLAHNVPGDLIETGVWRGGATILMRAILRARGVEDRLVWVADSFEGLPSADTEHYPEDAEISFDGVEALQVSQAEVEDNFCRYGLLDEKVRFLKGWFRDTLPSVIDRKWAVVRLDGDMYESTIDALSNLYPGLSPGGYLIIDDFHLAPCRAAVADYRSEHGIAEEIQKIDTAGVFWQKLG
jgi:O-methyltransferase